MVADAARVQRLGIKQAIEGTAGILLNQAHFVFRLRPARFYPTDEYGHHYGLQCPSVRMKKPWFYDEF